MMKKLSNSAASVFTGKGLCFGGSLIRPEATGYGTVYFAQEMLQRAGLSFDGMRVSVSGSGNVAQYAIEKAMALGAKVVTISDSCGTVIDEAGFTHEKLLALMHIKNDLRGRLDTYASQFGLRYEAGVRPWHVPVDVALPCATQNELDENDARTLIRNGVKCVAEGANMPATLDAAKPALAAAHGQGGQRVLQGLFESQELQHRQIDRRVEAHAALEGADGRAVLDAEGAVDLGLALVIGPADTELDHAFGLDQAFQQGVLGVMRVLLDEGPEAQHDLLDCLHEFGLLRIARGNPAQEVVQTLQFQDTASWQCDGAARCVAVQKRREVVRGCTLLVRNCGPKFVGRKAGIGRKTSAGAACRKGLLLGTY
ncbi:glutamate/leucine/phenylalanine/valine dehydrogenase [Bordetella pertussis H973]|nr:glutamate/leucine/phenylalanine/valine dehydrogenase [Bordetella pertussis H973]